MELRELTQNHSVGGRQRQNFIHQIFTQHDRVSGAILGSGGLNLRGLLTEAFVFSMHHAGFPAVREGGQWVTPPDLGEDTRVAGSELLFRSEDRRSKVAELKPLRRGVCCGPVSLILEGQHPHVPPGKATQVSKTPS